MEQLLLHWANWFPVLLALHHALHLAKPSAIVTFSNAIEAEEAPNNIRTVAASLPAPLMDIVAMSYS